MRISVVVPAYNEAGRIGAVLRPVLGSTMVDEVIVVDDGSDDGTLDEAKAFPVRTIRLDENGGKAAALEAGVLEARNDTFLFLDADLVGLTTEHVDRLITAYRDGELDMAIGIFSSGRRNTDFAQLINPFASGQRVLSRSVWERMREYVGKMGYGVEFALSKLAAKEDWRKERVKLEGVTHVLKEEKRGIARGLADRFKMYGDMIKWLFKKIR
jgi:glycosyltransferase involved in cell wall biosynthesis